MSPLERFELQLVLMQLTAFFLGMLFEHSLNKMKNRNEKD